MLSLLFGLVAFLNGTKSFIFDLVNTAMRHYKLCLVVILVAGSVSYAVTKRELAIAAVSYDSKLAKVVEEFKGTIKELVTETKSVNNNVSDLKDLMIRQGKSDK